MAQILKDEDVNTIEEKLVLLKSRYSSLVNSIHKIGAVLKNEKAKEYLLGRISQLKRFVRRSRSKLYALIYWLVLLKILRLGRTLASIRSIRYLRELGFEVIGKM